MARILLVDDDSISRSIIEELLSEHEVDQAATTDEAIELYGAHDYSAVVTDLFIPERGGLEVIRTIRQQNSDARIIAVSGIDLHERGELLTLAHEAGAKYTMGKPVDPDEFRGAIAELLSGDD